MKEEAGGLVEGSLWTPVIMSWIVIVVLTTIAYLGTRRMRKVPGPLQNMLEFIVSGLFSFVESVIGPGARKYAPFIASLFLYILSMNLLGLVPGFKAPTSTLNMTISLALCAFLYVQYQAVRSNGLGGYLKHLLGEPLWLSPLMLPIHLIGEIAKPLSLSIRLFGNIFGEEKIVVILALMSPAILEPWLKLLPIQFPMMLFAVFGGFIQSLIFMVLTSGYLAIMMSHDHEHDQELLTTSSPH